LARIFVARIFAARCSLETRFSFGLTFTLPLTFGAADSLLVFATVLLVFFAGLLTGLAATFFATAFFPGAAFLTDLVIFTGFALTCFLIGALTRVDEEALVPDLAIDLDLVAEATTLTLTFALVFEFLESDSLISASFYSYY
jgi:hypothetical protein